MKSQPEILLIVWEQQLQINRKLPSVFIRRNEALWRASFGDRLKMKIGPRWEEMQKKSRRAQCR